MNCLFPSYLDVKLFFYFHITTTPLHIMTTCWQLHQWAIFLDSEHFRQLRRDHWICHFEERKALCRGWLIRNLSSWRSSTVSIFSETFLLFFIFHGWIRTLHLCVALRMECLMTKPSRLRACTPGEAISGERHTGEQIRFLLDERNYQTKNRIISAVQKHSVIFFFSTSPLLSLSF